MNNRTAMRRAVETVREALPDFYVVMTDREQVLAASGIDPAGGPMPSPAQQAMDQGKLVVIQNYSGADFNQVFSSRAAVAAPLVWDDRVVGALMLIVPLGPNLVLEADERTAEGLAQMFSSMLELGELQHQVELRQQAELRALQSQINPHFLFNALNTISGLCLTNPDRAREIILNLAGYFRQTLSLNESSVTLEQELSNVNNYLAITQARFEDAIHVSWELPDDRQSLRLPPLILQPLVENAVRHGGTTVDDRYIHIRITQDDRRASIRVSDKGHGFPPEVLEKLQDPADPSYSGLFNVRKRLRSIYGSQCVFTVESSDQGSTVAFSIPLTMPNAA
jgi:two-component system sensor histidine kinase LytS